MEPVKRRAEAKAKLTMAVRRIVRAHYGMGPMYGELVLVVGKAEDAGLSRSVIARTIRAELEAEKARRLVKHTDGKVEVQEKVSKGTAARYVMLHRWERRKFLTDEKHVTEVEIDGHKYTSPVKALMSERHSFTAVFKAWRNATKPPVTDLTKLSTSPAEATEVAVRKFSVPLVMKENGVEVVRRVRVLESAEALAALLRVLRASPLAAEAEKLLEVEAKEVIRAPRTERRRKPPVAA